MTSLFGGWLYLVDESRAGVPVAHARADCREAGSAELRPVLIPYGMRPPPETEWVSCDVCGGAAPAGRAATDDAEGEREP